MRKTLNRVLACFLSVALLVSCCVSGLVLPAAASTPSQNLITNGDMEGETWLNTTFKAGVHVVAGQGYNGSQAWALGAISNSMPAVSLSSQLTEGKLYVFRAKVKGGPNNLWSNFINNAPLQAAYTASGDWAQYQVMFKAPSSLTGKDTFSIGTLYNQNANLAETTAEGYAKNPVYFDDFELYEYVPGMNLMPGADGMLLPGVTTATMGATTYRDFFSKHIDYGTTFSLYDDNGNSVWKVQKYPKYQAIRGLFLKNAGLFVKDKVFTISFKYKNITEGGTATLSLAGSGSASISNKSSVQGADGWTTYTADITATSTTTDGDPFFGYIQASVKDNDFLIDDFYFGEKVEAPTPTIDITETVTTVEEGKTVTLNATATPEGTAIEWTSSDNTVATVENGVVTGVKEGTVTITAKVAEGITDTCEVTVTAKPPVTPGQNLITNGDMDGSEWSSNANVVDGGYNNTKAFSITADTAMPTVSLSEPLVEGKLYVFRFKIKGGTFKLWNNVINWGNMPAKSTTEWSQYQVLFTANADFAGKNTFTIGSLRNGNVAPEGGTKAPLYFDDFELIEYTVGMNLMSGADGSVLPGAVGRGDTSSGYKDAFQPFIDAGTTFSVVDDGADNKVWKLTGVPTTATSLNGIFLNNNVAKNNLVRDNKVLLISFRYKSAVAGEEVTATIGTPAANHTTISDATSGTADADGWKTASAKATIASANGNFFVNIQFTGAADVLVDDFSVVEEEVVIIPTIDITQTEATVEEGSTVTLNTTVTPEGAAIEWKSSDETVATVANGVVTGVKEGTVTITAKVAEGITDTCEVTVTKPAPELPPATSIVISDTTLHLAPKAFHTLVVKAGEGGGSVGQINWSSNETSVATVDENGKVTAKADGTAVITGVSATNAELTVTCTVTVDTYGDRIIGGDFESDTDTKNWEKLTAANGGFVTDPADATNTVMHIVPGKSFYYQFNDNLLEPNSVYIMTGRAKGSLSTAVNTGIEFWLNGMTILSGPVTHGWAMPTKGSDGTDWASFELVFVTGASTNQNYSIMFRNWGEVDSYFDDIKLVKRTPPALESITLSAANDINIIALGDVALNLTATAAPNEPDVVLGELTWSSSNPAVATVAKTGDLTAAVTAVAVGETTITLQNDKGVKGTYTIKVMQPSTGVDITESTYTFGKEGMHKLTVTPSPAGTYLGTLNWTSSDSNIVSVEDGVIKGVSEGTAIVTVTSAINPTVTDSITVTVTKYGNMLAGGDFEKDTDLGHWTNVLNPDGNAGGSIIVDPDDPNNHILSFKPNPSPTGAYYQYFGAYRLIDFEASTTYVLTGRIKGNDKPTVGLNYTYVEYVGSNTEGWLYLGESKDEWKEFELVFTTKGNAPGEGLGKILRFANMGSGVCYFDDLVLAKQPPQTITNITLSKDTATYGINVTTQLTYTTTPKNNADLSTLQWFSSNQNVATVDQNGKVTTKAVGKTVITLKSSDTIKATCELTVVSEATSFTLSKDTLNLLTGATDTLITVATPYGATIPGTLTWSSSDDNVAAVNNGVVTAVSDGTATITCTNGTLSATCTVKVSPYGELIIGGDFQDTPLPDNWNVLVDDGVAEVVDDPLVDGNRYLVLKADKTTAPYIGLTLEANQLYLLTLRAKGNAATVSVNSGAVAKFYPSDASARKTKTDSAKWNTLTFRFRTKTEGTLSDVLSFIADKNGDTYIDDISLVKVPALTGISLSDKENPTEEVAPENAVQLTAKPVPSDSFIEGTVTWSSSDESVAIVDENGIVTAMKEGNAVITAALAGFESVAMNIVVDYYAPMVRNGDFEDATQGAWWDTMSSTKTIDFVTREGIGENGSNGLQMIGKGTAYYKGLGMVFIPNNTYKITIRYKSSAYSKNSHRIWGDMGPNVYLENSKGEWATVTKTFTVPSTWLPKDSYQLALLSEADTAEDEQVIVDSIDIRMYDTGIDAQSATLNPPEVTLTPGQSLTYMLLIEPSNANTNFMVWTSSNDNVATVNNGEIFAVGGGTATITATIPTSTSSVKAVATVTVEGESAILQNGSFDIKDDTSWTLTDATIKPQVGVANTNALALVADSVATQTVEGLKPGTVYVAQMRSFSVGGLSATVKVKQDGVETPLLNSSVPNATGWKSSRFEFVVPDDYEGGPLTFELAARGSGTAIYLDLVSVTEGYSEADLIVSDIMWNNGETQMKPGTPVNFTVVVANVGTEATKSARDIVVELRVNTKTIRTFVHKGGLAASEQNGAIVALTTDPDDPWLAEEGELVISAHVNTTLSVLESNNKNNGIQTHVRVAEDILEAPQLALNGGFNKLVFSDDFDTLSVDTKYTGDYGYRWYLTDIGGISADEGDFHLTGDGTMIIEESGEIRYNWTMATTDAVTGAGWEGFTHGYLEFRIRFSREALPGYTNVKHAPSVWSFTPSKIAPDALGGIPELSVEMDWMEYWSTYWTITMHEMNPSGTQWMRNNGSYEIRAKENDIGDGEWHTLGYRWEAGMLLAYLDGRQIFRQTWGPDGADPMLTVSAGEFLEDSMMSLDKHKLALILAGTAGKPLEIDYIRVWQADGTLESKPVLDNTFLEDHLTNADGTYFTEVTADNYEAIIAAVNDWIKLSGTQQDLINDLLVQKGGKEFGDLLFEAQTLANAVESFIYYYAVDEYGEFYTTVDETNYDWILRAAEEWDTLTDLERAAINKATLKFCGMTFDEMLTKAAEVADNLGGGSGDDSGNGDSGNGGSGDDSGNGGSGEGSGNGGSGDNGSGNDGSVDDNQSGVGGEEEIPSPEDGVPFPTVALVGLFLGGTSMIFGKKRRDEE